MKISKHMIATAFLLIALPLACQTGWNNDAQICKDKSGDEAIAACTRAIQSGQLSQVNLATTYNNRGVEWRQKGEFEKAMADYDEALRINPSYIRAYANRAGLWIAKRQYDKAIDDFRQAFRLNPTSSKASLLVAVAQMHKGNVDYTRELNTNSTAFNQDWPMPMVQFYLGKITQGELESAVKGTGAVSVSLCDLYFYLGEWQLFHGQKMQGLENLKAAKSNCDYTVVEYVIAKHDLIEWQ